MGGQHLAESRREGRKDGRREGRSETRKDGRKDGRKERGLSSLGGGDAAAHQQPMYMRLVHIGAVQSVPSRAIEHRRHRPYPSPRSPILTLVASASRLDLTLSSLLLTRSPILLPF